MANSYKFKEMKKIFPLSLQNNNERLFQLLNQCIPILVGIFIFFNSYPQLTAIQEISFYGSVLLLFSLICLKKTRISMRTPLTVPFLLFVLWSFIGLFFALNKENSLNDFYAHLIKYLVVFYMLFNFFNTKEKLTILVWTIVISTAIFSIGIMTYYYFILGNDISNKLGLYIINELPSNIIGILTLFAMLLCLYQLMREEIGYRKIILSICLFATTIATLATQTRSTLLAMIASLLISFFKNKKAMLVFLFFLAISVAVMPVKNRLSLDGTMSKIRVDDRIHIWYGFIEMVKDHPITGIGFGMQTYFDENLLNKYNERVPIEHRQLTPHKAPHNLLIDIAVRTGVIGLLLFLYIIFASIRMGWRTIKNGDGDFINHWGLCFLAALTAVLIQGCFENTLSGSPAIILYTIMAMMAILWHLDKEARKNEFTSLS